MEIIEKTPEKFVIRIPANESLANAIRRSVSEIPVLAIDEVEIFKNDSALYDEIVAHRLGLVPLKTEKSMNSKTKIESKLSQTGPCTIYSEDLKGDAEVVYGKIPITLLGDGKKMELVTTASLGKGVEHSKYMPGLCYYRHLINIKSSPKADEIISNSKFGLLRPEKKGQTWTCDLSDAELNQIENIDKGSINDSDELLFVIESYGNMPAPDIFTNAIKALTLNLDEFEKEIK